MAAGDIKLIYGTAFDLTITLASLASDANLLTGRESALIDLSTDGWEDFLISGKITTAGTPTANRSIQLFGIASYDGTSWPDVFVGSDGGRTISSNLIKPYICGALTEIATDATARTYHFSGLSLRSAFRSLVGLPPKLSLFATHSTGVALSSTAGDHLIRIQPIRRQVAQS
jgi:hypothetical protein